MKRTVNWTRVVLVLYALAALATLLWAPRPYRRMPPRASLGLGVGAATEAVMSSQRPADAHREPSGGLT